MPINDFLSAEFCTSQFLEKKLAVEILITIFLDELMIPARSQFT
jgi:hypothetical protein